MSTKDVHLVAILDRSGSMSSLTEEMRKGFNELKAQQLKQDGETVLTLVTFDNEYERLYTGINARLTPDLSSEQYFARGSTALLDAIGKTLSELKTLKNVPKKTIVVIATDGFENASKEYKKEQIKTLVKELEGLKKNPWSFIFMGAGVDAFTDSFGYVNTGRTINTTRDYAGTQSFYGAVSGTIATARVSTMDVVNNMDISGFSNVDYGNNPTPDKNASNVSGGTLGVTGAEDQTTTSSSAPISKSRSQARRVKIQKEAVTP